MLYAFEIFLDEKWIFKGEKGKYLHFIFKNQRSLLAYSSVTNFISTISENVFLPS